MTNSSWDIDFRDGLVGEATVARLLTIETVEVKTDRQWKETGNVYIETECYYRSSQEWEPSGIMVSEATHWALVLQDVVLLVARDVLLKAISEWGKPITCDIEPNPSRGFLITPNEIMEYMRWKY
jgi:hypothetical protein